ncbi:uncharacterized protein FIBRA_02906 [Fibroporia radiculosa]|uniref:Uncharacterized protein n=1 Tax=Fibroporia radiculosa TaxID=599839 RepID=J4GN67_9APHY|nr:uncharacterized protein FIBRA_02906 [Fibroporia radiculosa]CCM00860.1 predicted protein [Fibroporia radiculosa]
MNFLDVPTDSLGHVPKSVFRRTLSPGSKDESNSEATGSNSDDLSQASSSSLQVPAKEDEQTKLTLINCPSTVSITSDSQIAAVANAYPPNPDSSFDTGDANRSTPEYKRIAAYVGD